MRSISPRAALAAALLVPFSFTFAPSSIGAQQRSTVRGEDGAVRVEGLPGLFNLAFGNANRAVLGITMEEASRAETEGVRIASVDADGPAAKAGLKAGDVITSVNGVSLRVSADDAADPELRGIAQRRLTRTLAKAKAGDAVELRVGSGGSSRTVSVKTVSASELANGEMRRTMPATARSSDDQRGVIGLSIGGTGSVRDTLGLFVGSVVASGPAEKSGIVEGDRIAAVNGVDVRVPREDVEDPNATSARASRFMREIGKVVPGGAVTLRVYADGRYREVRVTAVKRSELPSQGFRMSIGDGDFSISLPGGGTRILRSGPSDGVMRLQGLPGQSRIYEFDGETLRRSMDELRQNLQQLGREPRVQLRDENGRARTIYRGTPRRAATEL